MTFVLFYQWLLIPSTLIASFYANDFSIRGFFRRLQKFIADENLMKFRNAAPRENLSKMKKACAANIKRDEFFYDFVPSSFWRMEGVICVAVLVSVIGDSKFHCNRAGIVKLKK